MDTILIRWRLVRPSNAFLHFARAVVLAAALALPNAVAQEQRTYTLGVVPQFETLTLIATWQPLVDRIEAELGISIELELAPSIPSFERAFLDGVYDFAFMNPYHVVMAADAQGYRPIVTDGSRFLSGILVVRADSPVTSVAELDGGTFAFPAPNAFGASLYMRALLTRQEGLAFEATFAGTHSNGYRTVLVGQADAAGGVRRTLLDQPPEVQEALRIIYETPRTRAHPIAAHPRVPDELSDALVAALIDMADTAEWRELLANAQLSDPLAPDFDTDYAPLRDLGLDAFAVQAEP